MNHLNSIILEGGLVKPPVFTETPQGVLASTFSIAVNRFFKADGKVEQEISHFDIEAYGKLAESISVFGDAGRGVRIVGRLQQKKWMDAEGKPQSKVVIEAEHIEFRPVPAEAK
jgi:single-strand DNA-binding protein